MNSWTVTGGPRQVRMETNYWQKVFFLTCNNFKNGKITVLKCKEETGWTLGLPINPSPGAETHQIRGLTGHRNPVVRLLNFALNKTETTVRWCCHFSGNTSAVLWHCLKSCGENLLWKLGSITTIFPPLFFWQQVQVLRTIRQSLKNLRHFWGGEAQLHALATGR